MRALHESGVEAQSMNLAPGIELGLEYELFRRELPVEQREHHVLRVMYSHLHSLSDGLDHQAEAMLRTPEELKRWWEECCVRQHVR